MGTSLQHEVALVTGAGRGIGRAVAMALAREGAAVAVTARTESEIAATAATIADAGGRALAIPCDVRDDTAVQEAARQTATQFGAVTVLVNNAGTPGPAGNDWETDPVAWFECIDVIVRGALLMSRAVIPGMIARGSGRIINMASVSGTQALPPIFATSVAKTALIRFTEGLAGQLAAHGVRVFAVHPGIVRTRLLQSYGLQIPDDWCVPPEQAADLCVRLAGGAADALSGRFLTIADDLDELRRRSEDITARELYTLRIRA